MSGTYLALYLPFATIVGAIVAWALAGYSYTKQIRRRTEEGQAALANSQRQVVDILNRLPIAIIAVSAGNRELVFANPAADELLMGRTPRALPLADGNGGVLNTANHPFAGTPVGAVPRLFQLIDISKRVRHLAIGSTLVSDSATGDAEIIYMIQDETVRIETEHALEHSHRLEALGTLTSGVAHDFNNMLTPILGSLDMIRRDQGVSESSARAVERALQATGRASTLVQRLLAFSREQVLETHKVDLKGLIEGAYDMFGRKLGPNIESFVTIRRSVVVEIDPNQLELAILNLMANARDAMPEGGELSIAVEEVHLTETRNGLEPGRYACISVTDSGSGMTDEVRQHAVEPFYTTKEMGEGSGLGLSMVDGLAAQSGGRLTIESQPGHGTRIDVWLPSLDADQIDEEAEDELFTPAHVATILVVDDEEIVRNATADMLADFGHTVIKASSGSEAISMIRRGERIDAIVADHLMPGMTGGAMAHEIWDFAPDMPVLLISGYALSDALPSDIPKLAKPFRANDLARAVEKSITKTAF